MPKRDWIKYAALGVVLGSALWALWAGWLAYGGYRIEHKKEREKAADHDISAPQKSLSVRCDFTNEKALVCIAQQPDAGAADEHTKTDLKAQQDVAEWAFIAMLLSGAGVIVTGLGTFFVARSLVFSAKATHAALRAVEISENASHKELRAYLGVDRIECAYAGDDVLMVRVWVKNYGSTPAINVSAHIVGWIDNFPLAEVWKRAPELDQQILDMPVSPGAEFDIFASLEMGGNVDSIFKGEMGGFVVGRIGYKDIFNNTHFSKFAYRGTERTLLKSLSMRQCYDGNYTDDNKI